MAVKRSLTVWPISHASRSSFYQQTVKENQYKTETQKRTTYILMTMKLNLGYVCINETITTRISSYYLQVQQILMTKVKLSQIMNCSQPKG